MVHVTTIAAYADSLEGMANTVDEPEDVLDALFQVPTITVQVMTVIIECLINSGKIDAPSNESLFCGDGIDNDHDEQTDDEDPDCQV
jgi:hypothetical protein